MGLKQTKPSSVSQVVYSCQPLILKHLLIGRANLELPYALANLVHKRPCLGTELAVFHQGPLFLYYHPGIRLSEFLDLASLGFGQLVSKPVNFGQLVCFTVRRVPSRLVLLPHGNDHKR